MEKILFETFFTIIFGITITLGLSMIVFHFIFWYCRPSIWLEIWSPEGQQYIMQGPERQLKESDPTKCSLVIVPQEIIEFRLPVVTMDGKIIDKNKKIRQMFIREYLFDEDKDLDPLNEGGKFNFEYSGLVSEVQKIKLKVTCRFRKDPGNNNQLGLWLSIFQHTIIIKINQLPSEIKNYINNGIVIRQDSYRKVWLIRPPLFFWQKYKSRDITKRAHLNNWDVVTWERENPWEGWK